MIQIVNNTLDLSIYKDSNIKMPVIVSDIVKLTGNKEYLLQSVQDNKHEYRLFFGPRSYMGSNDGFEFYVIKEPGSTTSTNKFISCFNASTRGIIVFHSSNYNLTNKHIIIQALYKYCIELFSLPFKLDIHKGHLVLINNKNENLIVIKHIVITKDLKRSSLFSNSVTPWQAKRRIRNSSVDNNTVSMDELLNELPIRNNNEVTEPPADACFDPDNGITEAEIDIINN